MNTKLILEIRTLLLTVVAVLATGSVQAGPQLVSETVCADVIRPCSSCGYCSTPVRHCWQQACWIGFRSPPTPGLGADNLIFDGYPVCTFDKNGKNASNLVLDDYASGYNASGYKILASPHPDVVFMLDWQVLMLMEAELRR